MSLLGYGKEKHGNYGGFGSDTLVTGLNGEVLNAASKAKQKNKTRKNSGWISTAGKGALHHRGILDRVLTGKSNPFTKKNRAKRLSFNASNNNGIQKNGYVEAQTENNNTEDVRHSVGEQKFIKRILDKTKNAIIKDGGEPLDLKMYKLRLEEGAIVSKSLVLVKQKIGSKIIRNQDLTREEAILIYDELIALFIILTIHLVLISKHIFKK
jgi:hypothetical protein